MTVECIGLHGLKYAGKDTVFSIIKEFCPYAKRYAFADRLRECLLVLDPWVRVEEQEPGGDTYSTGSSHLEDWGRRYRFVRYAELIEEVGNDEAKKGAEVRRLQQVFGTDVVRDLLEDGMWTRVLCEQIKTEQNTRAKKKLAVVTDVRFDNEAAMLRNHLHAHVWNIKRPQEGPRDIHRSEAGIKPGLVDYNVANTGTLEDLRDTVKKYLELEGLLKV